MTKQEFTDLVGTITPDNLPNVGQQLIDAFTEQFDAATTATEQVTAHEKTINELRDTNMKLFVRQSQPVPSQPQPEDKLMTPEEIAKEMFENGRKY